MGEPPIKDIKNPIAEKNKPNVAGTSMIALPVRIITAAVSEKVLSEYIASTSAKVDCKARSKLTEGRPGGMVP